MLNSAMQTEYTPAPGRAILWKAQDFKALELFHSNAVAHTYPRHSHPTYMIGVIEAGVGCNDSRGTRQYNGPGSIVVMNPDEVHGGFASAGPCSYRMLYLGEEELKKHLPETSVLPHFASTTIHNPMWANRLRGLHQLLEVSKDSLERQTMLAETLTAFLVFHSGREPEIVQVQEHRAVKTVMEFLETHLARNIEIEELARLTALNRSYLMRVFLASTGITIHAFLMQVRIEAAKRALCAGISAADVATDVGFADQSHLIRCFKRYTGTTPSQYAQRSLPKSLSFYPWPGAGN